MVQCEYTPTYVRVLHVREMLNPFLNGQWRERRLFPRPRAKGQGIRGRSREVCKCHTGTLAIVLALRRLRPFFCILGLHFDLAAGIIAPPSS